LRPEGGQALAKSGLNFFPLDCQLDDKFGLIEAEFGLKGFAVIIKLLQKIYGGEGYYCNWTDEVALLFSKDTGLSDGAVSEIVKAAIRRGIFSEELYKKHEILSSKGIQKRYLYGQARKLKIDLKKEYLLLDVDDLRKNVCIIDETVCRNQENAYSFEQTKRNETKRNETKQDETEKSSVGDVFSTFERCGFQITSHSVDELTTLSEEYSAEWVIEAIKRSADRGKKSIGYIKGILSRWQIAGAIDDSQKPDQTSEPTKVQKERTASLKDQVEKEAEAMIEREREQMMASSQDPQPINYNFIQKI
jgi:DnaD/phage-associated family protein